jgi:hypothetical protein
MGRTIVWMLAGLCALAAGCGSSGDVDAGTDSGPRDSGAPRDTGPPDAGADAPIATDAPVPPMDDAAALPDAPLADAAMVCTSDGDCAPGTICVDLRCVVPPPQDPAETRLYVLSDIDIPEPTPRTGPTMPGVAAGFDVDGLVTIGDVAAVDCVSISDDFESLEIPAPGGVGMEQGVDNAFGTLVPGLGSLIGGMCPGGTTGAECIHRLFLDQIARGDTLVGIEVRDVESYESDVDGVTVQIFSVRRPSCFAGCSWSGTACTPDPRNGTAAAFDCTARTTPASCTGLAPMPSTCAPTLTLGMLAPGQTFERAAPLTPASPGSLRGGRLYTTAPLFGLTVTTMSYSLPFLLHGVELGAHLTPTALDAAALGGTMLVDDLVMTAEVVMPGIGPTARSLLESIADFEPSSDPLICRQLSAGLDITGVPATVP